ncbi:acetolactate synthase small subunit [Buchnera aphidicola]|uniref:acetolactate synthase small subunit n=1 Tax=Buchnera aphidicola TaxID=9 RepID=UPI003463FFF3
MKCDLKNKKHSTILNILLENEFGALLRVISIISQYQKNQINNLTVFLKKNKKIFDITIEIIGKKEDIKKIPKKLYKLINVIKIYQIKKTNFIIQKKFLINIQSNQIFFEKIKKILSFFKTKIIYFKDLKYIIEISENSKKMKKILEKIKKLGKIIKISKLKKIIISKN